MVEIHDLEKLREMANLIISEAKKQGAEQAQVIVYSNENIATRYGEKHITQNTQRNSIDFNLITKIGQQVGEYQGSAASKDKIRSLVENAITLVKYSLPDPEFPGFIQEQPKYPKFNRKIINIDPMEISEMVKTTVDVASKVNSKISAVAGNVNYNATRLLFLNSYDVEGTVDYSTVSSVVNAAATSGTNESRSTGSIAGVNMESSSIENLGRKVAERALSGLNQQELEVGKYNSILSPEAVMELMFLFGLALSSEFLINFQSPFRDKLGEQLFDKSLTLTDATDDITHYSSQKFDTEGVISKPITYLQDGIIKDFAYNRRNAKKLGVETNGRAVGGFAMFRTTSIKPGNKTEDELIKSIDDGVYVTNLFYTNFVNMPDGSITGLTRDGLFRIKNGEIVGSLKNMRFSDTLYSMFKNAEPSSEIVHKLHQTYGSYFGLSGKLSSVKLNEFNFSSKGKH